MTLYKQWQELNKRYDRADEELIETLGTITAKMQPGSTAQPNEIELDAFFTAKDRLYSIRQEMDEFLSKIP